MLRNRGGGAAFDVTVVGRDGSHNLQMLDADGDFDIDVRCQLGAPGLRRRLPVTLWRNTLEPRAWRRFEIDAKRPGMATSIMAGDPDGDGLNDLVTGGFAYTNPGRLDGRWVRQALGSGAKQRFAPARHRWRRRSGRAGQQPDMASRRWPLAYRRVWAQTIPWIATRNSVALALNNGGEFRASTVIEQMPHDWVHGAVVDPAAAQVYLSMHAPGSKCVAPGIDWRRAPVVPLDHVTRGSCSSIRWMRADAENGAVVDPAGGFRHATGSTPNCRCEAVARYAGCPMSLADLDGDGHAELATGDLEPSRRPAIFC